MRVALAAATCALLAFAAGAAGAPPAAAPDGPGSLSHFDLARKDCLGTARNTTSQVWFTVANGVLSDVYYPTVDNTNVETLQFVVTDGATFTDLESRDMTSTARALDDSGMSCEVTSVPARGGYKLVTDYVVDPSANALLMRVALKTDGKRKRNLQLYVRFDPTVNGNGGGGSGNGGADNATIDTSTGHAVLVASDPSTVTNASNRDYAQPVFAALDGSFSDTTSGFAGTASDGLTQLDSAHALTAAFTDAMNGNVVQTARLASRDEHGEDHRRGHEHEDEDDGELHPRARLRRDAGDRGADGRERACPPLRARAARVGERLGRLRPPAERPAEAPSRPRPPPRRASFATRTSSARTC